ncbi:3-oxoacyl-ACP reductase [Sphaerisporangium melleum]|uniref:3-oxoacyl-ACP reductase n=1 Tax=Sphaerisporangium melleum TaxID=321316 RepID=A0A917VJS1_9ACTN|nr:SDR family oxidoreductase [Sphaerisporangium melleum]GGK87820.1 3-oxoacyl-ACP reductase [Sphaerisporangium melleum]GII72448.1 3-oxoacyl-ACP reductase [Sphaerisporangium melleum]
MNRFDGQVALITGGSRGIGLACARRLVAEGARVCLTARGEESLAEAVKTLGGPRHAITVAGRADDPGHRAAAVARTLEEFGRIDVLVNNSAVNPAYGRVLEMEDRAVRKTFDVNVGAALGWLREARRAWLGDHGGAVVNIAALAGLTPAMGIGVYGASKAALIHLTRQLAQEMGPRVRVNAVAPAVVRTKFAARLYEGREDELAGQYALGRLGTPEDIAGAVAFLASDDASWITGQTLVADGGIVLSGGGV